MADVVYIDVDEGSKRVMNNTKLYAKLLTKFKDDTNFIQLQNALAAGDTEKALVAAHTLKGLSANLSLMELHKYCIDIEKQIKSGTVDINIIDKMKDVNAQTITEIDKVIADYAG